MQFGPTQREPVPRAMSATSACIAAAAGAALDHAAARDDDRRHAGRGGRLA